MLLGNHDKPFATRNFLVNPEAEFVACFDDFFALLVEDSREDGKTAALDDSTEFREQVDDDFSCQVREKQIHEIIRDTVNGAAEGEDIAFVITVDIRDRDLNRDRVDIASDHSFGTKQTGRQSE